MLDLVFGLMLATSGLTDPGLENSGLDRRRPEPPAAELAIASDLRSPLPDDAAGADATGYDARGGEARVLGGPLNR